MAPIMMQLSFRYGSHLPVLMQAVNHTSGDILELGAGIFSTPYLHAVSVTKKRRVLTYENFRHWYRWFSIYDDRKNHVVQFVKDWDKVDERTWDWEWDVVLVDQTPDDQRKEAVKKLANKAKYIVIHDTNDKFEKNYHYSEIYPLFKYKFVYDKAEPSTTVLSNFINLDNFL